MNGRALAAARPVIGDGRMVAVREFEPGMPAGPVRWGR